MEDLEQDLKVMFPTAELTPMVEKVKESGGVGFDDIDRVVRSLFSFRGYVESKKRAERRRKTRGKGRG